MARKYYISITKLLLGLFVLPTFAQCTQIVAIPQEMIGTWRSEDGATIQLNIDSTFIIKNFDSYFFRELTSDKIRYKVNAEGK